MVGNWLTVLLRRIGWLFRKADTFLTYNPRALCLAFVMLMSTGAYVANILITEARYRLSHDTAQLIGRPSSVLAKKIKLDQATGLYRFNAENISPDMTNESDPAKVAALLSSQKQQTGGGGEDTKNLYSLDLPIDPKQGTTIYDSSSKSSFRIIPDFAIDKGRSEDERVVYPIDGGGQAIYSVKGNGVKEDIVLTKPRGDELSFGYKLELPKTLTARLDAQGDLGIYSIDPAVISAIASTSSTDTARLKDVQENGDKTHLAYLIPAPAILQSGPHAKGHRAKAKYELNGTILTVSASGLEKLTYPISIDPSVVVTSTSDFATGNNDGNISFDTDAISRAAPTAGSVAPWTATTSLTSARSAQKTVAYNGYLYTIGGSSGNTYLSTVEYAPINANGSIGAWTATTSLTGGRQRHASVAYNGYLYVTGGNTANGRLSTVEYAPINADGSIGTWTATTSLTGIRSDHASVAYNGYLYVAGGYDIVGSSGWLNTVEYAPINADGSIGTWTATTSLTGVREDVGLISYNGNLYVVGGDTTSFTNLATVEYAPINADGTIGAWKATSSLNAARSGPGSMVYNGYLYAAGGFGTSTSYLSDIEYAPINADGSIGAWTVATGFATARGSLGLAGSNGYIYILGGYNGADLADVQYTKIDLTPRSTITMGSWATTTPLGAGSGSAAAKVTTRANHGSAVYNGYIYLVAGTGVNTTIANVHYAPLNANGTVGTWLTTTSIPAARAGLGTVAVNGYLYAIGGQDSTGAFMNTSYYAPINANGTVGTWSTTTALTSGRSNEGLNNYNGYMYVTGGVVTGGTTTTLVEYAPINANGSLGAWVATTALPVTRGAHASMVNNGFIYVIGGSINGAMGTGVSYAPLNANGTVGTWNTTSDLPAPRGYTSVRIYQGYVFIIGGYQGSNTDTTTSYYAKINADGTLGTWSSGPNFTTAREGQGVEIYNGYIYITGGWNGTTIYGDVQYASLTFGPPVVTTGSTQAWQSTTASSLAVYGQATVVYNNYVYLIGGYGGSVYRNDIRYAPFNADGTIGAWSTAANSMSLLRFNASAAVYNGYLYVTGGQQAASTFTNTVEYTKINADGSLNVWQTSANAFTTARYGHVSFAYNGKLYVVGGGDANNVALSDVKYATINADGSIGTWADTTATTAERDTDGFIYGGRMYITGGVNGTTYSNTVRYATINADGTVGAWTTDPSAFTTARSRHAVAAENGYIYLSGGANASGLADLQYASINADGSLGTWVTGNNLTTVSGAPTAYYYHTMVARQGKLYSLAGVNGSNTPLAGSYLVGLNVPALRADYSKLVNLGQAATLNSIVTNGIFPIGQSNVSFRVAGTNGIFGNWQSSSSLIGVPQANVKYVMYKINLNDSTDSTLTTTGGRSSVTDITIDYTLPVALSPANRLRHNKYFDTNGALQPLQTP